MDIELALTSILAENKELKDQLAELKVRNAELAGQVASLNRWLGEAKDIIKEFTEKDLWRRVELFT